MPNRPIPTNMRPVPRNLRLSSESPQEAAKHQAETTPEPPSAPAWLSAAARPHWQTLAKEMQAERMWRPCFAATLATYVELLSLFLADPQGFGASKLVTLRLFGADLGLTPSAFNRVSRTSQR